MIIIGHLTSVVTPPLTAYLIVYLGHIKASVIFITCNLLSWMTERKLFTILYNKVSELHVRHHHGMLCLKAFVSLRSVFYYFTVILDSSVKTKNHNDCHFEDEVVKKDEGLLEYLRNIGTIYWRQSVYPVAIALALMFMTVLGFDGVSILF